MASSSALVAVMVHVGACRGSRHTVRFLKPSSHTLSVTDSGRLLCPVNSHLKDHAEYPLPCAGATTRTSGRRTGTCAVLALAAHSNRDEASTEITRFIDPSIIGTAPMSDGLRGRPRFRRIARGGSLGRTVLGRIPTAAERLDQLDARGHV